MNDHFTTLGVTESSTAEEIKKAYRRVAMKYHPDRNLNDPSAEAKFKEANAAYEILADDKKRTEYINSRKNPNFNSQHKNRYTHHYEEDEVSEPLSELFRHFNKHKPIKQYVTITLENAFTGKFYDRANEESFYIPPGTANGTKFFIKGSMVEIIIMAHDKFKRSENDLLVELTISVPEAILGIDAVITHLDKTQLKFKIPAGIQSGQIIRLAGKGMPIIDKSRAFGDLLVRCSVTIPKEVGTAQKLFYKSLMSRDVITF